MYEKVRKLEFEGAAFSNSTTLDLFSNDEERMKLIYGKNGSGKSTISRAFEKIKGCEESDILQSKFIDDKNHDMQISEQMKSHIHVFNDDYIQNNVRVKEDGLDTIVMLGDQGNVDDQIELVKETLSNLQIELQKQNDVLEKYNSYDSKLSPYYWKMMMDNKLSGDDHWAGRRRKIESLRRNASVFENTYKDIIKSVPKMSEEETREEYRAKFILLKESITGENKITSCVPRLNKNFDQKDIINLLRKNIEKPQLSEREKFLLNLVESGRLEHIQKIFSDENVSRCPCCFQPISVDYRKNLIHSIQKVLSREVELHKEELERSKIEILNFDLKSFEKINKDFLDELYKAIEEYNDEAIDCNNLLQKKIDNPFDIVEENIDLETKYNNLQNLLYSLQNEVNCYNSQFNKIGRIRCSLNKLNDQIAYFEIKEIYDSYEVQKEERQKVVIDYNKILNQVQEKRKELRELNQEKANIKVAIDLINKNLKYVFFSTDRLSIKANEGVYSILSRGHSVKPKDISVGERNIIALCYFFAELLTNLDVKKGYSEELLVVIDDPVSSFDFENKVGIMSFLRCQINKLIEGNCNTKLIIMTHDLPSFYDINRIFEEVSSYLPKIKKIKRNTISELKNGKLVQFQFNKRNEYSEMLKNIYFYALNADENELTIGNTMRRVLEAYSTFTYCKGIEGISYDKQVLDKLGNELYKDYFENHMYRLVLNGESHMKERAIAMNDYNFDSILSTKEKQQTAKDILCFLYLLNPLHVKCHLEGVSRFEDNIRTWCNQIKKIQSK